MIYWFTGQPGHGKTNQALKLAHDFKAKGREVYVCNVRKFDAEKAGMKVMTPEQFIDWPNSLPDGSVVLCDEAYEHGMLPKRAPGAKVPEHVEQLAKHRHKGLDFIFVSQSPDKQVDQFVHDLIERQMHVRRRFGTNFVHIREFDRFERNPEKANPLVTRRTTFWKPAFEQYESTVQDTSERKIPWYFFAFAVGAPFALWFMWYTFGGLGKRLGGETATDEAPVVGGPFQPETTEPSGDGGEGQKPARPMTTEEYAAQFMPRVQSQPWSAPAYDQMKVSTSHPPRLFCMSAGAGQDVNGKLRAASCSCVTEQGTTYTVEVDICRVVAKNGQYEPFRIVRDESRGDGVSQQRHYSSLLGQGAATRTAEAASDVAGAVVSASAGVGNGLTTASDLPSIGGVK